MVNRIESSILRGGFSLGVFFDIEGAFDNVITSKVTEGFKKKGAPKSIIDWYDFYLRNRYIHLAMDKTKKLRKLVRGIPQGGILSPLAWNVVFDDLLDRMEKFPGVHPVGYADDGMFIINGKCPNTLIDLAQPVIDCASEWGKENGLKFSTTKTVVVLLTTGKQERSVWINRDVKMDSRVLKLSDEVKYLGLILNRKLTCGGSH